MANVVEKRSVEDSSEAAAYEALEEYQASKCPQCGEDAHRSGGYCSRNCEKDARDGIKPG